MKKTPFILLSVAFILSSPFGFATQNSEDLKREALQFIDKNETRKALQLLEKAFELAAKPEDVREVAILILQTSPKDYPKREAYLRYLIQFATEHTDHPLWLKEMGDRAFERSKLEEAEDFYLRSLAFHPKPNEVNYRLAYVYWNQKKHVRAFEKFLDVYAEETGELRKKIGEELAKVWWENGALPDLSFNRFQEIQADEKNQILNRFFEMTPRKKQDAKTVEAVFLQLRDHDKTKAKLKDFITSGFVIKDDPCLLFWKVIEPADLYPREHLLSCVDQSSRPRANHLLAFFQSIPLAERNEKIDWTHSNLLYEDNQPELGLQLMLESQKLTDRTPEYVNVSLSRVEGLSPEAFAVFEKNIQSFSIKTLVLLRPKSNVLARLQNVNPDVWIPFEEESFADELTKDFWIKKTVWLAAKPETQLSQIREHLNRIFSYRLTRSEEAVKESLNSLEALSSKRLPDVLNEDFEESYDSWTKQLDQNLNIFEKASPEWQIVTRRLVQQALEKNLDQLKNQVRDLRFQNEGLHADRLAFERRKVELRENIDNKYQPVMISLAGE